MKTLVLALVLVTTPAIQQRSASDGIAGPAKEPARPYSCRMYDEMPTDRWRQQCLIDGGQQ